jgi:hypothetical protein
MVTGPLFKQTLQWLIVCLAWGRVSPKRRWTGITSDLVSWLSKKGIYEVRSLPLCISLMGKSS